MKNILLKSVITFGVIIIALWYGFIFTHIEKPMGAIPNIDLVGEPTGQDYWVWIQPTDKFSMDSDSNKGVVKKGDIIAIQPVNDQYQPTSTEQQKFIIIKVNGITSENKQKYVRGWNDCNEEDPEEPPVCEPIAYRQWQADVDTLKFRVGMDSNKKNADSFDNYVIEKTQEDLIAYEQGRKLYVLKNKPKQLAWKIRNYVFPHAQAAQLTNYSCVNGSSDAACNGQEDFNNLILWEADTDYDLTASNTGDGAIEIAYVHDDDGILEQSEINLIAGATTDSGDYRKVMTPTAERHNGTISEGTILKMVTNTRRWAFQIGEDFFRVDGLIIWQDAIQTLGIYADDVNDDRYLITNTIFYGAGNDYSATDLRSAGSFYNCLCYDYINHGCFRVNTATDIDVNFYNLTADNSITGFKADGSSHSNLTVTNSLGTNNSTGDFYSMLNAVITYSASEDSTADNNGGAGNMVDLDSDDLYTDQANNDFHIGSTTANSLIIDCGTSLSGFFTDDIDGDNRPYPVGQEWDMGADEESTASPSGAYFLQPMINIF